MVKSDYEKEYESIWGEAKEKISEVFKRYAAMTSQGLDKEGEQAELRKVWREIDSKIRAANEKYDE